MSPKSDLSESTRAILRELRRHVPVKSKILVAVSGGIDSVSLLHGVLTIRDKHKLSIEVAHFDHAIRSDSRDDARFVAELSERYGVPFHIERGEPPERDNLESWGRTARYAFFRRLLGDRRLDHVLTAHTANDQVETFFLRLIANKEPRGILQNDPERKCLRPLLSVSRDTIERYRAEHRLEYREDPTNRDTTRLRNKVRHHLLPLLTQEFERSTITAFAARTEALTEDIHFLDSLTNDAVAVIEAEPFGSIPWTRILKREVDLLPEPVQWRLVQRILKPKLGFNIGREAALAVVTFLRSNGAQMELPSGLTLRRESGGIVLMKTAARV